MLATTLIHQTATDPTMAYALFLLLAAATACTTARYRSNVMSVRKRIGAVEANKVGAADHLTQKRAKNPL